MFSKINKPMTGKEVSLWLPGATIMKQAELRNYKVLPKLPLIILYEVKPDFGHWVTVLNTPEGIEHFDSYSAAPDDELGFISEEYKKVSNQDKKHLLKLLLPHDNVNYNQYIFQGEPPIATCGRWSILRNLFSDLTIDQFYRMINRTMNELNISSDELVSMAI